MVVRSFDLRENEERKERFGDCIFIMRIDRIISVFMLGYERKYFVKLVLVFFKRIDWILKLI